MEPILQALDHYFDRLIAFWREDGTWPLISWSAEYDQSLYLSGPDDDGEAEWKPTVSEIPAELPNLCPELRYFFGCRRYWSLAGRYKQHDYTFEALPTDAAAVSVARIAILDGEGYLGSGYVLLAAVTCRGNDDLVLLYNQHTGKMTLLDIDKETTKPLDFSLAELIDRMEVLI